MKDFKSNKVVRISSGAPNRIESTIDIKGFDQEIEEVIVSLDIDHTYTADLSVVLFAPSGKGITLVHRRGGSGNNFRNTVFDENAEDSIRRARPPFNGTYKPEGRLSLLKDEDANGVWTLVVSDFARRDGGSLNQWSISIGGQDVQKSKYSINVEFQGGLSATQMEIFK